MSALSSPPDPDAGLQDLQPPTRTTWIRRAIAVVCVVVVLDAALTWLKMGPDIVGLSASVLAVAVLWWSLRDLRPWWTPGSWINATPLEHDRHRTDGRLRQLHHLCSGAVADEDVATEALQATLRTLVQQRQELRGDPAGSASTGDALVDTYLFAPKAPSLTEHQLRAIIERIEDL